MYNCFIILAAGESKRFNSVIPKVFYNYKGKPLIQHSIEKAKQCKKIKKIVLVVNKKHRKYLKKIPTKNLLVIDGGKNRAESAYKALKEIKKFKINKVLIHDAARPDFSNKLLDRLLKELKNNNCVIPTIKTNDSVKLKEKKFITNLKRENIYLTQTPQGFKYSELYKLQKKDNKEVTDDANLFIASKKKIKFINGEISNNKITLKKDIKITHIIKYGIGFDVHRLVPNKKLYLGGVKIPFYLGTLGHSDGDPVLHAVTDALLGACCLGDIGRKFSDKSKKFKNIRSTILLSNVIKEIKAKSFSINNIDINIIAEKPKIKNYKDKIQNCIAKLCDIDISQINIKGKTTEKLGLIGQEKAIACEVIASVIKND